jgi:ABC-type polysaccharide/polyol phosphate transport system ATPase subunit
VTPAIAVEDLTKSFRLPHEVRNSIKERFLHPFGRVEYEENRALDRVSFTVEQGEFFGIIGPNGSGKSTLLKLLAGIYVSDSGRLEVNGKLSPFIELGVGFNEELNARDNIRINAALLGLSRRETEERFDEIISFAGLERFVDQRLKNYSSGMQVRLAYAIAIQVEFEILLLDEVLAVGDEEFQQRCYATFERLRGAGKTIVFVSHDLEAVRQHCDRVLLVAGGRVQALGPPDDVLDAYRRHRYAGAAV